MNILTSWELDANIAHENENNIKRLYVAFVKHENRIPTIDDMLNIVKLFNLDVLSKSLSISDEDKILSEYEKLEDKNMFAMMGDYIRTVIVRCGGSITDSSEDLIEGGVIEQYPHAPNKVAYGDAQTVINEQFEMNGIISTRDEFRVRRGSTQYIGLGEAR